MFICGVVRKAELAGFVAAWEWYVENKSSLSWDVTFLSPPWVFAVRPFPSSHLDITVTERTHHIQPAIHEVDTPDNLNSSNLHFYKATVKNEFYAGLSPLAAPSHGWIDGRDVAELHVRALEVEEAGNERIVTVAGQFVWQDAGEYLHAPNDVIRGAETDEMVWFLSGRREFPLAFPLAVAQGSVRQGPGGREGP